MCGRGAVCVLMAVMSGLALVQSEGVPGMTDGGTPGDSDDDPPPWVMEDFDPLELEGLQLRDSGGIHRMESGSGTVGNGRLPPSVSDLDSNSLLKEVDTESNTEEPAAFNDHSKLSDGKGSAAGPEEQQASLQVEEPESSSENVQETSFPVSDSAVAEDDPGEDQRHGEQGDVESPEQLEGSDVNVTQGTQWMEEHGPSLQEERQPQEGEEDDDGKEGEKEEEEGDLTFEEFKRRKMMEQEAAQQVADSIANIPISKTKNNYASVDCGAKVISTNQEARNPTAILIENRDVYMLNPCSADIWFVVELCDMVSVQTLEIACLELFSSVPESFNVYSAERYPDPEWVHLGKFQARNEREVQSFPLATDQHVYAKYIKVEMVSHYGREHYCPISLLRVLGASMIEVFQDSEERKEQQGQSQPGGSITPPVVLPPSEGFSEDDSLGEIENERSRENGALLTAAKDAVLTLLEQPLNLLGKVNGFMKPGEGGGDRTRHVCKEEGVEGCLKEMAVSGDEMGEQKTGTLERTSEGDEIPETTDQDTAGQDLWEGREGNISEEDHHPPSESTPDVATNGLEENGERSSPHPEETRSADPDRPPTNTTLNGSDFGLGPSDPHSFETEQEPKETSTDSESTSKHESSAQNSKDPEERSPQGGEFGQRNGLEVSQEDADRGDAGGQFQDGGELNSTTVGSGVLKTQDNDTFSKQITPPLEREADILAEGEELGAGDGDWGLPMGMEDSGETELDDAGIKASLRRDGPKDDVVDGVLPSQAGEATVAMHKGLPLQPLGPEVVNLGNTNGAREGGVPLQQRDLPGTSMGLGPTMAPEEDNAVVKNGANTSGSSQEVESVGNQEVDVHELPGELEDESRDDTATAVQDSERRLSQEPSRDDVSSWSEQLDVRENVGVDKNGSNGSSLVNAAEMEDAGSHGNEQITEKQLNGMKSDEDGPNLGFQADRNGAGDRIPVHESLHNQPPDSEHPRASLDLQNVTGGSNASGSHAKSSNETLLPPTNVSSIPAGQPKEKSVFVRLSNRIRDLEVNMSLFSSYLDQLSSSLKRNKNRTEDTQKSLDKRISALNESLQFLKQEAELSVAGLRGLAADLCQVTSAMQDMAAGLHSTKEEITSQNLFVGLIQMTMVTLQLLAVCLCLRCKQRSLGNELRNLRTSVARIPTQRHVTLPWDHMTKNHTHESQTSCYAAGLQPSNHIREGVPESEHLGGSDYYNCKDRVKDLATPSQSSLEGSDWDSEPWQLAARRRKKGKSNKSKTS